MKTGVYPGSFDPITMGHLDIIIRAAGLADNLIIGVLKNTNKKSVFSLEDRVNFIERVIREETSLTNVTVEAFDGLLVDFVRNKGASLIIRGLRAVTDFEYELQIAQMNHKLDSGVDTVFFTTSVEYSYLSSSAVREIASFGGDIRPFVPKCIVQSVYDKYKSIRSV
jgi:pantetheine-phosphate adenylyltransferase